MARMNRVRTSIFGMPGGPGVATMYFADGLGALPFLRQFWLVMSGNMPADVTIQVENVGDIVEATDGSLVGQWTAEPVAPVVGLQTGAYASLAGFCTTWETGAVADGSRVRGRTFIVPTAGSTFDLGGSISADTLLTSVAAGTALINATAPGFYVWHRPRKATLTLPARPGLFFPVKTCVVHDRTVVLRSRRD